MSVMEKVFGAFKPTSQVQPGSPVQPNQPQVTNNPAQNAPTGQTANTPGTAPNGVVPAGAADAPAVPLEKYKDLWTPPTPATGNEGGNGNDGQIDPQKLMEAAARVDFTKVVDAESMAKIAAGGEEAAQTLVALLNKTAQQVYGQSTVVTSKIVEQAVAQARDQFIAQIPDVIRKQGARAAVFDKNPAFSNPAVAPLIEAQVAQLALKYPKATPSELEGMAQEYLKDMANLINPQKNDASSNKRTVNAEDDWSAYT